MKKILFIHSSAELYGSDKSLLNIIRGLSKDKFDIFVVLPEFGPLVEQIEAVKNVKIVIRETATLRRKNFNFFGMIKFSFDLINSIIYMVKIIKENSIDIVYTNTAVSFSGAVAAKLLRKKNVWHIREIIKNKYEKKIISVLVNVLSDVIIVNSKATGNSISRDSKKIKVIYNAVDNKSDRHLSVNNKDKNGKIIVGMAGRINRWKGQNLFVDAADLILKQEADVEFVIAGSAYSGEEYLEENLKKYINDRNLNEKVKLIGLVKDMEKFYESIDIFVLPSIQPEPFGLVVIEAMEHKLPVIATNHGGPREIIRNGDTGYLVEFTDPNEIVKKCLLLIKDDELRENIGNEAFRHKRQNFSVEKMVFQIEKLLEDI